MAAAFRRRRELIVAGLNQIPGLSCVWPDGAFYAFPNIPGTGQDSRTYADALMTQAGVAVLPGTAFGAFGEGYIRISFANSEENLSEALRRIDAFNRTLLHK
jgi:aspartate/methionine/tyrosine aminotransferase